MGNGFRDALAEVLRAVPDDSVTTCGAVARALGDGRAARAVSTWISQHPDFADGRKVVRADGRPVLQDSRTRTPPRDLARVSDLPPLGFLDGLRHEQLRVARRVDESDPPGEIRTIGAVDVSYAGDRAFAAAVRCDRVTGELEEIVEITTDVDFPYIPTYLAFREFNPIESAVRRLRRRPDVLFIDGHGRLHPARAGFACYAGVRLDLPTIGVAKHPLVGRPDAARRRSDGAVPIELDGAVLGYAWAPPSRTRPLYVSVGHRITLETALRLTQETTKRAHPEPLRVADRRSKERRKEKMERGGRQWLATSEPPQE